MKFQFESDLDFQTRAVAAVVDLFRGAERGASAFTVLAPSTSGPQADLGLDRSGVGNRLNLAPEDVLENLRQVQLRERVAPSAELRGRSDYNFTVEMETGTGKTYVYLRTMLELFRQYGFSKFIIVVPSVAIRAGVLKTLQMTREHFLGLYNEAAVVTEYDSSKMGSVRSFATSRSLQVMVMTVGAINKKDVNNLYKGPEGNGDEAPINLIKQVAPIIIIDEPQSVDGVSAPDASGKQKGGKGKEAVDNMAPLFTIRYSATHKFSYHMVYKLDAVAAYNQGLVKEIRVAAARVEDAHNLPYVSLTAVVARKGQLPVAKVELDVRTAGGGVVRAERLVNGGDDLEQVTRRAVYKGVTVTELSAARDDLYMKLWLPGQEIMLRPGQAHGSLEPDALHRVMIRRTIQEHFERALLLRERGIKVLSLFFIDHVERYRQYRGDDGVEKGPLATIFEEEFVRLASRTPYASLYAGRDLEAAAAAAHDGYFSKDRRGRSIDTSEGNESGRDAAEAAYRLIMTDKEKLLSFATPLEFIFSHSALREGWDNPNVFQITALREFGTETQRRQVIGRGLRIAVNQQGERVRDEGVNKLTVIANESYEDFAARFQAELEEETGIRFGFVEEDQLAALVHELPGGQLASLGAAAAKELASWLQAQGYVHKTGKAEESLKRALLSGTLKLPERFRSVEPAAIEHLQRVTSRIQLTNADEPRVRRRVNGAVLDSPAFRALWDRIKHKTTYRVEFDALALAVECARRLQDTEPFSRARVVWDTATLTESVGGVGTRDVRRAVAVEAVHEPRVDLPDVLTELQDRTHLTRRTLARILIDSGRLYDFERNPQEFIRRTADIINDAKRDAIVEGIKYVRLGDQDVYGQELFRNTELTEYLKGELLASTRSPYDYVVLDSEGVERAFAKALESNEDVKVYAKLPGWFKVPTPLGSYNPDWAVLIERDGEERLYFVVETKGSLSAADRRGTENQKIKCAEEHFAALRVCEPAAQYVVERTFEEFSLRWI